MSAVRPWLLGALALLTGGAGCAEWLEVDDGTEDVAPVEPDEPREPAYLPDESARLDGKGPLVPATPGLRVPDGYWTRVRLDVADLYLPYSWISLLPHGERVTLRLQAVGGPVPESDVAPLPALRLVVSIGVPEGTTVFELAGLTLRGDALREAMGAIRTTPTDNWLLELDRLTIEEIGSTVVKGTIEGHARRGSKSVRTRKFHIGFVALWAKAPRAGGAEGREPGG